MRLLRRVPGRRRTALSAHSQAPRQPLPQRCPPHTQVSCWGRGWGVAAVPIKGTCTATSTGPGSQVTERQVTSLGYLCRDTSKATANNTNCCHLWALFSSPNLYPKDHFSIKTRAKFIKCLRPTHTGTRRQGRVVPLAASSPLRHSGTQDRFCGESRAAAESRGVGGAPDGAPELSGHGESLGKGSSPHTATQTLPTGQVQLVSKGKQLLK